MAGVVPVFDHEKITVIFVLGGPGAGSYFWSLQLQWDHIVFLQAKGHNVPRSLKISTSAISQVCIHHSYINRVNSILCGM